MNLRLKLALVIVIILLLSLGMMKVVPAATVEEPLIVAMESTGAQLESCSINAWTKLPNAELSDEELEKMLTQIMQELGVKPSNYQLTRQQKNNQFSIQAETVNQEVYTSVIIKNLPSGFRGTEKKWYLVMNIETKAGANLSISKIEGEIRDIFEKFGSSPHISTCLIGWLNGTLRDGEQQHLVQNAFKIIDAKIINKLEAEHFISYTGFSSGCLECLEVGAEKVNLNMAIHYSKYNNRTYVTIGSPIITREY